MTTLFGHHSPADPFEPPTCMAVEPMQPPERRGICQLPVGHEPPHRGRAQASDEVRVWLMHDRFSSRPKTPAA